jgi:hypothetical protein
VKSHRRRRDVGSIMIWCVRRNNLAILS